MKCEFDPKTGEFVIRISTKQKAKPSKSGKMMLQESTGGFVKLPEIKIKDREYSMNLNFGYKEASYEDD